eukprot:490685_1
MAEIVQKLVEDMIPELNDLQKKKLFTKPEIKSIVRKREHFEYLLQRRTANVDDFKKYVEYEKNMDKLRRMRKRTIGGFKKSTVSDYAPTRRINFIFERAVQKFKGDMDLWNEYIDFMIDSKSTKALNKTFARLLQLYPTNAALWIRAAQWEYAYNGDVAAARAMLTRGLRVVDDSVSDGKVGKSSLVGVRRSKVAKMWRALFQLEMANVEKLRRRRVFIIGKENRDKFDDSILAENTEEDGGVPSGNMDVVGDETVRSENMAAENEAEDADMDVDPERDELKEGDSENSSKVRKIQKMSDSQMKYFRGAMAEFVYNRATESVKGDLDFCLHFLRTLPVRPQYAALRQSIRASLTRDFPKEGACWRALALEAQKEAIEGREAESKSVALLSEFAGLEVFERAVSDHSSISIWSAFSEYIQDRLDHFGSLIDTESEEKEELGGEMDAQDSNLEEFTKVVEFLTVRQAFVYKRAHVLKMMTASMFHGWAMALLKAGDLDSAVSTAKSCTECFPTDPISWTLLAQMAAKRATANGEKEGLDKSIRILESGLRHVPASDSTPLVVELLDILNLRDASVETTQECFRRGISSKPKDVDILKEKYITWSASNAEHPSVSVRSSCSFVLANPARPSAPILRQCIHALRAAAGDSACATDVRRMFETALEFYGDSREHVDFWHEFIKFETSLGNMQAVKSLYWRATKFHADLNFPVNNSEISL